MKELLLFAILLAIVSSCTAIHSVDDTLREHWAMQQQSSTSESDAP